MEKPFIRFYGKYYGFSVNGKRGHGMQRAYILIGGVLTVTPISAQYHWPVHVQLLVQLGIYLLFLRVEKSN